LSATSRSGPKARVRVNRELAILKNLCNRMRDWQKFQGSTPVVGNKKVFLKEHLKAPRYLDHDEEAALLAVAAEPARSVILVGIHAGLRIKAEACNLRWSDVDLRGGTLSVQAAYAKNGAHRTVPLNSVLARGTWSPSRRRRGASFCSSTRRVYAYGTSTPHSQRRARTPVSQA
jgi:integrase